ncbi:MAG: DUF2284 domain-containing protein [Lachnospiraceae bacterium]|jgi:predicted metal-binding protein|nr:DUF2284 domain-containing protein [Lachnospiraceae bacterium]
MEELQVIVKRAAEFGFDQAAPLDCGTIMLLPEVRDMCKTGSCGQYGKNWSCPPACGELARCREQVSTYGTGILVQTVGKLEDSLDYEGMKEAEGRHKEAFLTMADWLRETFPDMLPLGSGCCTLCKVCSFPDAPCRFPGKRVSSMEAYGILVSGLCEKNGVRYYYGPGTIAYTGCYLLR